jgi:xylan 1,4-beta-xylosidase
MKRGTPAIIGLIFLLSITQMNISCVQSKREYFNPILAGFYPDPSMCRVGSDYFLVNSTFSYFPGIPVFQSQDLVKWRLIGHVLDRPEQLDLDGLGVSRGIFAPAIRYHQGKFYVTCTLVDKGGNFVVITETPAGPWSNPVWIPEINGIDPSLFFDENGKTYIVYNSIAPDDRPLYEGHRTIRMYEFDTADLKVIGPEHLLVNGGTDITKKPVWIEAPHIFQKNGYYYLICAEGGTADQHSEVVFRSGKVEGSYIPYENNPILTQRHLNPGRDFPITSTGHADCVETETGEWWAVFLGCRPYPPYQEGYYNTGRETFLAPVVWKNGWPIINPDHAEVQYHYPYPVPINKCKPIIPYSGNFKIKDEFDLATLDRNWIFLRTPREKWYDLRRRKGFLAMQLRPESCSGTGNPTFLGHRQQHLQGSASLAFKFLPQAENEKAGILIFQNENHFYFLCKSLQGSQAMIQLFRSGERPGANTQMELIISQQISSAQNEQELYLKITAHGNTYSFHYGFDPVQWLLLKDNIDATYLSTRIAGGFVGCVYALYATSLGEPNENIAYFDWFEYEGNDETYH